MKFVNSHLKTHLFFVLFVLYNSFLIAQFQPGAKNIALSNSNVASVDNAFSLFSNPAGLSKIKKTQFGLYYSPSPFGMKELANGFLTFNQPTIFGSFAIGGMNYGFDLYKENGIYLGYSNIIMNKFLLGITIFDQFLQIKNYGNTSFLNLIVGGIFLIDDNFSIGFSLQNPLRNKKYSPLSANLRTGLTYKIIEDAKIHFSVFKEVNFPISFSSGIEYDLVKFFSLRFGIQNSPNTYSGGFGINYSFFNINYAILIHQDLGITHQIGLTINFTE